MRQNYIRADTLVRSNASLVAAQAAIPLARAWGGGDVASADGLRFVVPVRTIHSGPNPRYFGQERGVTYYNLTSDQFTGLGGIVVPGTLRDSLALLSVLLEQETALQPTEVMTDTGAYTDVMFGIFHLLGFQFSRGSPTSAAHGSGAWTPKPTTAPWMAWRGIGPGCRSSNRTGTTAAPGRIAQARHRAGRRTDPHPADQRPPDQAGPRAGRVGPGGEEPYSSGEGRGCWLGPSAS